MPLTPGPSAPVARADDQVVMQSATDRLLTDLGEVAVPEQPVPVDLADEDDTAPRYYRLPLPSGGTACVRVAGEGDPVILTIPGAPLMFVASGGDYAMHLPNKGVAALELQVTRDTAWALWAVLSDALMPLTDRIPEWALQIVEPSDEQGEPLPS